MKESIIQSIGFVGVVLFIASYQIKSNRRLFICQMLGCSAFCLQFILMGAYTGALSLVINIARNILLINEKKWKWATSKVTLCVILLLLTLTTAFTWAGLRSILPFASVMVTTLGYWARNAAKIRASQLFGSPCYLVYDCIVHSWGGVISESFATVSILLSIYRFGWKKLSKQVS